MIPDHLIAKALNAWIGDHNCPHPDLIHVYRVLITRSLEAVAADIWDEATSAQAEWDWLAERGREGDIPEPQEANPYRASED